MFCLNHEGHLLNLTRNFRLCSHHFDQEKIIIDGYTSADPVYFARNNRRTPLSWGRQGTHRSAKPWMNECCQLMHHNLWYSGSCWGLLLAISSHKKWWSVLCPCQIFPMQNPFKKYLQSEQSVDSPCFEIEDFHLRAALKSKYSSEHWNTVEILSSIFFFFFFFFFEMPKVLSTFKILLERFGRG